jgi:hypothetical protein
MMIKIRKSPDSRVGKRYIDKKIKENKINEPDVLALVDYFRSYEEEKSKNERDANWQENNLEYDLRTSDLIYEKCKNHIYAQNLYAALCNNNFIKNDIWPLLQEKKWSCSWRYAGGIVADIQEKGDYVDWYCSGIQLNLDEVDLQKLSVEQQIRYNEQQKYVNEGIITEEIKNDLLNLGWVVVVENK